MNFQATLQLQNGIKLDGIGFGSQKVGVGEVVFNTAITGYQEIMTDPSYDGQIITFTYPHIGNTGINKEDYESKTVSARGLIVRNFCDFPSNWRSQESLEDFLLKHEVICISDIDTRYLTKILRDKGCMVGAIYPTKVIKDSEAMHAIKEFGNISNQDLISNVSTKEIYNYTKGKNKNSKKIVAFDFGIKENILKILKSFGAEISVVPPSATAEQVLKIKPDGIFLSNGPGDPTVLMDVVAEVKKLMSTEIPIFGICLGHQIMSLAYDLTIEKMPFGHHGANHPVCDLRDRTVFITSQNHNFAVAEIDKKSEIIVTHRSLFDNTIQGIEHKSKKHYSIQCHPEASPGPQEFKVLFNKFFKDMDA